MFCSQCGANNQDNAFRCVQCGAQLQGGAPMQPGYQQYHQAPMQANVPNNLVMAILVTLFCCLPLGIVSIVYASQVNTKLAMGDYAGAMDSSSKARSWAMWGMGLALLGMLAYIALIVVGVAAGIQP